VTGFYPYGKIAPFNGDTSCELHNKTMTFSLNKLIMNLILKRQLTKYLIIGFNDLEVVGDSYSNCENQIVVLLRAIKINTAALFAANKNLKRESRKI
jgi:hypothetical protein